MRVPVGDEETDEDLATDDQSHRLEVYETLIPGFKIDKKRHYAILTAPFLQSSGIQKVALEVLAKEKAALT